MWDPMWNSFGDALAIRHSGDVIGQFWVTGWLRVQGPPLLHPAMILVSLLYTQKLDAPEQALRNLMVLVDACVQGQLACRIAVQPNPGRLLSSI